MSALEDSNLEDSAKALVACTDAMRLALAGHHLEESIELLVRAGLACLPADGKRNLATWMRENADRIERVVDIEDAGAN